MVVRTDPKPGWTDFEAGFVAQYGLVDGSQAPWQSHLETGWQLATEGLEGADLVRGDQVARIWFAVSHDTSADLLAFMKSRG